MDPLQMDELEAILASRRLAASSLSAKTKPRRSIAGHMPIDRTVDYDKLADEYIWNVVNNKVPPKGPVASPPVYRSTRLRYGSTLGMWSTTRFPQKVRAL